MVDIECATVRRSPAECSTEDMKQTALPVSGRTHNEQFTARIFHFFDHYIKTLAPIPSEYLNSLKASSHVGCDDVRGSERPSCVHPKHLNELFTIGKSGVFDRIAQQSLKAQYRPRRYQDMLSNRLSASWESHWIP